MIYEDMTEYNLHVFIIEPKFSMVMLYHSERQVAYLFLKHFLRSTFLFMYDEL